MLSAQRTYTTDEVRYLTEMVYGQGLVDGYARMAQRAGDADAAWVELKRVCHAHGLARRLREAHERATRPGRREFPHGWDAAHLARVDAWVAGGGSAAA